MLSPCDCVLGYQRQSSAHAGYLCSHSAHSFTRSSFDSPQTFATDTSARCVPCTAGEFCPEGSYEGLPDVQQALSRIRRCPKGSYCPDAASNETCPSGTYCIEGSVEQHSCNFTELLLTDALDVIPVESPTVLERIYKAGDPLGGNYCPAGSSTPLTRCAPLLQ
jgi:hypothetical protein